MKSVKLLPMLLIPMLILTGCSQDGAQQTEAQTEASAKIIHEDKYGKSLSIVRLPFDGVTWDDHTFSIKDVRLYREKSGHGYILYAVIDYDMSALTDDDIHFLTDAGLTFPPFNVTAYVTSKANDLDFYSMRTLHRSKRDGILSYMFYSGIDEYPNDFSDVSVSLCTTIEQGDGTSIDYNVYCGQNETVSIQIQDVAEMTEADQDARQKGLDGVADRAIDYINSHGG